MSDKTIKIINCVSSILGTVLALYLNIKNLIKVINS